MLESPWNDVHYEAFSSMLRIGFTYKVGTIYALVDMLCKTLVATSNAANFWLSRYVRSCKADVRVHNFLLCATNP